MVRNILRDTRDSLMILIKWVLFLVPKNNNLIVANAWFGQKYADNTMYEFEYLLENTSFNVVWTTKNRKVFDKLKREGKSIYFDDSLDIGNSRKEICSIICQLMDGNFKTNWGKITSREQSKPEVLKISNKIKKM